MRMRNWVLAAAVLTVAAVAPSRAAAQPAKGAEPTVEVRVRSINDLLNRAEYVGGLLGKEDVIVQVRELVKQLSADGKGVEGVDPKRPFGAYVVVTNDIADSPVVVMIPIADQARFLDMLKDRLSIVPEKAEGGTLKANLPLINEAYFRFANGYLYAARMPKHLDPKTLPDPKAYFADDDGAVASLLVRIDRIPADLKTFAIGQLELQAQEAINQQKADPIAQKVLKFLTGEAVGGTKMVLEEGKSFSAKVYIDPKTDEIAVEAVLTPKDGTQLAKNIAGLAGNTSLPAAIASGKDVVARGSVKIAVPADHRAEFAKFVDETSADVLKQVGGNEKQLVKRVIDTLGPTARAGELDAAAAFSGPDAKGKYTLVAAVAVKEGKNIEQLVKDLSAFAPANEVEFTFDADKAGNFTLHKVDVKNVPAEFEGIFGTKTIWVATSADCYAVFVGADVKAFKAALTAVKPVAVPVLSAEVSLAKVVPLAMPQLKPDEVKAAMKEAFGGDAAAGKDTVTVTVEGGKQLTARAKVKGRGIKLFAALDAFKF